MNRIFTLLLAIISFLPFSITAQYSPGVPAFFGIDGDVKSGALLSGTANPNGTHDWFKKSGNGVNVGLGIIDTSGSSVNKAKIAAGQNFIFNKGMAFSRYSSQDGYLLLDARYARDNFGISGDRDLTTYTNGAKNGDLPTSWSTTLGATVGNGDDIIDTYIHMRRNGTVINNTNPSALILAMGISTVGSTGERYCDFELYRTRIDYNTTTGLFSNSGPAANGGHSAWEFNTNGSVKTIGDMTVSFAFSGSTVSQIAIWIWVNKNDYLNTNPQRFDFVPGEFYGNGVSATWGYAKIVGEPGNPFNAWGSGASAQTTGPSWGTNSKAIGTGTNYASTDYAAGDFAEAAIDLTSLGIDPALSVGMDPCSPPYTRMMAKTRSSSSFTSALQDFIGPYEFLDAPQVSAQITPASLSCKIPTANLSPTTVVPGAVYHWTTSNGNILTNPDATIITVDKAGTYYLSASIVSGCIPVIDSTVVTSDYYQPIATAYTVGVIDPLNPLSTANIQGGDVALSNFSTPFGGSVGLNWDWKGPNGYTSTARNNTVTTIGTYTLTLTESRNGCKDTAYTPVPMKAMALPVVIKDFSAVKQDNDKVAVKWLLAEDEPKDVELMRSFDGKEFTTITHAMSLGNFSSDYVKYNDDVKVRSSNTVYYRLKITENSGALVYSRVIAVKFGEIKVQKLTAAPNPARTYTVVSITNDQSATATIQIISMNGTIMQQKKVNVEKGTNQFIMNDIDKLQNGMYIIRAVVNGEMFTQKLLKTE